MHIINVTVDTLFHANKKWLMLNLACCAQKHYEHLRSAYRFSLQQVALTRLVKPRCLYFITRMADTAGDVDAPSLAGLHLQITVSNSRQSLLGNILTYFYYLILILSKFYLCTFSDVQRAERWPNCEWDRQKVLHIHQWNCYRASIRYWRIITAITAVDWRLLWRSIEWVRFFLVQC